MNHVQILMIIIIFMMGSASLILLFVVYSKEKYVLARYFMIITFLMTLLVTDIILACYFFEYNLFPRLLYWLKFAANLIYYAILFNWIMTVYPVRLPPVFKAIDRISKGLAVLLFAAVIIIYFFHEEYLYIIRLANLLLAVAALIINCCIVFLKRNLADFKGGINWNLYTKFYLIVNIVLYPSYVLIFLIANKDHDFNYFVSSSYYITIFAYILNCIFSILFLFRSIVKPHYQLSALSIIPSIADHYGFSDRETQIAAKLIEGLSYNSIGNSLFISTDTVKTYVKSIYRKAGVKRRQDLAKVLQNSSGRDGK